MFVNGYALNCTIASQQMPKRITEPRIACIDFSLQKSKMKLGVQVGFCPLFSDLHIYHEGVCVWLQVFFHAHLPQAMFHLRKFKLRLHLLP